MFLVNLGLVELAALFAAVGGLVVALYLLDRSRRRQVVATLRFWTPAVQPIESSRRRRIRQWPSLLLELAGILLLLLALAQLKWGRPDSGSRDHVLLLDTSAWMGARSGQGIVMDQARAAALAWVAALPSHDRVMVVHADALTTPVTSWETDRTAIDRAIRRARPGPSALRLRQSLEMAARIQRLHVRRPGEIAYAGPARTTADDLEGGWSPPASLRWLPVQGPSENTGLRKIGVRRSSVEPDLWQIHVSVRNYGARARVADLSLQFGGALAGVRRLRLPPSSEQEASFEYRTKAAGWIEARLRPRDALAADDRAVVELPALTPLRVWVCSDEPDLIRPLLAALPMFDATYRPLSRCGEAGAAGLVILDRVLPAILPPAPLILIEPPAGGPGFRARLRVNDAPVERWRTDHPVGAGLHAADLRLEQAQVFEPASGDVAVAEVRQGPVILARPPSASRPWKTVALGFHPMRPALRYQLATPLLFANILRWLAAESFLQREIYAASVGTLTVPLESDIEPEKIRVRADGSTELPFTVANRSLRFYAGLPGSVQVTAGGRELVYSLSLPEVAEAAWQPPGSVRRGVPGAFLAAAAAAELWPWLALAGGLLLLTDWLWFGRSRSVGSAAPLPRILRLDWRRRARRTPRPAARKAS